MAAHRCSDTVEAGRPLNGPRTLGGDSVRSQTGSSKDRESNLHVSARFGAQIEWKRGLMRRLDSGASIADMTDLLHRNRMLRNRWSAKHDRKG